MLFVLNILCTQRHFFKTLNISAPVPFLSLSPFASSSKSWVPPVLSVLFFFLALAVSGKLCALKTHKEFQFALRVLWTTKFCFPVKETDSQKLFLSWLLFNPSFFVCLFVFLPLHSSGHPGSSLDKQTMENSTIKDEAVYLRVPENPVQKISSSKLQCNFFLKSI